MRTVTLVFIITIALCYVAIGQNLPAPVPDGFVDPDVNATAVIDEFTIEDYIVDDVVTFQNWNKDGDDYEPEGYENVDYIIIGNLTFSNVVGGNEINEIEANLRIMRGTTVWFALVPEHKTEGDDYVGYGDVTDVCTITFADNYTLSCGEEAEVGEEDQQVRLEPWPDLSEYLHEDDGGGPGDPYEHYPEGMPEGSYVNGDFFAGGLIFESTGNTIEHSLLQNLLGGTLKANAAQTRWRHGDRDARNGDCFAISMADNNTSVDLNGVEINFSIFHGICVNSTNGTLNIQELEMPEADNIPSVISETWTGTPPEADPEEDPPPGRTGNGIYIRQGAENVINISDSRIESNTKEGILCSPDQNEIVLVGATVTDNDGTGGIAFISSDNNLLRITHLSHIDDNRSYGIGLNNNSSQNTVIVENNSSVDLNHKTGVLISGGAENRIGIGYDYEIDLPLENSIGNCTVDENGDGGPWGGDHGILITGNITPILC